MIRSLDLDSTFKPTAHTQVKYNLFKFPGGEVHIKLDTERVDYSTIDKVIITNRIMNGDDLLEIAFARDALLREGISNIDLVIPYFPYARQDRVMNKGEAFTLKTYANIINSMNFGKVYMYDAHSYIAPALVDRSVNISSDEYIYRAINSICITEDVNKIYLVSPDAGASKKVQELAIKYSMSIEGIVQCTKIRDTSTGELTGFEAHMDEEALNHPMLVVDDICDGGRTFQGVAEAVGCTALYLFVTHGIFSKGYSDLLKDYKRIFCMDTFQPLNDVLPEIVQYNVYL